MASLRWKFHRLSAMSAAEVAYRSRAFLYTQVQRAGLGLAVNPPAPSKAEPGRPWVTPLPTNFDSTFYCAAADRVISGSFDVFAQPGSKLGFPPDWNKDPKTGLRAPMTFGKTIDYRDSSTVGNIKYLWEPNRHSELTLLAQAYHLSGEIRYANAARVLVESWIDQCPYPYGPNWVSSLELAIRLINWAVSWHLLGGANSPIFHNASGDAFLQRWLRCIYQHCHFVSGYLSRFSSANNHLLGELTGLFVASVTWPLWPECERWRKAARTELEAEAITQNWPDGVNREQALYYQHEVLDMMILARLFGNGNGTAFSDEFELRIQAMLEYVRAVMDVGGNVPMIGDADDALLVRWNQKQQWCPYRSLLATGAVLFGASHHKKKAGEFDDKSRWLLGDAAAIQFERKTEGDQAMVPVRRKFPHGGYYVLGEKFDEAGEVRAVVDAGALGYLSLAAHGHADALSFTLSISGHEVLVDPGTYSYHTDEKWRTYFRGTSAHNTARIDGLDQSEQRGNFMWSRKANASCEDWQTGDERDLFIGSHDGYTRLRDPVVHRRKIEYHKSTGVLIVEDLFECRGPHLVELHWHVSERSQVRVEGATAVVDVGPFSVQISMAEKGAQEFRLAIGQEEPPLGWVSRRFDHKVPSPCLVWDSQIEGTSTLVTVFQLPAKERA